MIQSLEPRRLLHSFSVTPEGFLVVQMFDINDRLDFTQGDTAVNATIYDNGVLEQSQSFVLSQINSILVYGSATANKINLGNVSIPVGVDAGKGSDSVTGGLGRDTLKGGPGNDTLIGNDGDDVVDGGKGRDNMTGGAGRDILDYLTRTENLRVILSDTANGGAVDTDGTTSLEFDTATTSFEIVRGGSGNDYLSTTSSKAVTLIGSAGNDTLIGGKGNDALVGDAGLDVFEGNNGNDSFYAQDGTRETLRGGAGTDVILQKDSADVLDSIP